jgi:ParB family transcriptional regulator, chromosome partitioning protein
MEQPSSQNKIDFRDIDVEKIRPNPWNPNRMGSELLAKLTSEIRRKRMILPLVTRPVDNFFQIIDGEHRWQAAVSIGMQSLPCIVVEMDEAEARLKTLQLNRLRGEDEPELLARLLRELNIEMGIEQLANRLPYDRIEIEQSLELLEIRESAETRQKLEREMQEMLKDRIFSVIVNGPDKAAIEQAINLAQARSEIPIKPGCALARICEIFSQNITPK